MTRVAHIWKDLRLYHGIHEQLLTLARFIDRNEFELHICILAERSEEIALLFEDAGVHMHYLNARRDWSPLLIPRLARVLSDIAPDIVQTYCADSNVIGGLAARLAHAPSVVAGELTRRDQAPSRIRRLRDKLLNPLDGCVSERADRRVFVSEAVKRDWVGGRISAKDTVIYPAFNSSKSRERQREGRSGPSHLIGIVARLSEEKRHTDLIEAMRTVTDSVPDAKLVVVGDGPLAGQLKRQVVKCGLAQQVVFTGFQRNVFSELARMDVFALPSRSEGCPISILEAMACGLPVVATKVGGIPELVVDRQTGILVSVGKIDEIATALVYLLEHPLEANEMGEKGRTRAREVFGHRRFVQNHEAMYRELCSINGRANRG